MRQIIIDNVDRFSDEEQKIIYRTLVNLNVEFHVQDIEKYCEWRWNK